ncbi:hypothetical protein WOLCODRAFT_136537 [Wolfiporia cocos MD-104 SS10]|uniref:Uncharacterized protein n=1 Tax=Wolfiporia cocos (strain MD-104) TaxID=742152 RepID=A0A2H3JJ31_WOLCO|nr:hypothetical protein WOLCODRAFT_136537 [Wolfiporia cocos MD-104 SS10]
MRNQNRTAQSWKKINEVAEGKQPPVRRPSSSSDEDDEERFSTHHRIHKRKKTDSQVGLPKWTTLPAEEILISSDSDEDEKISERSKLDKQKGKRTQNAIPNRGADILRARSRSKSITPPPELPAHAIQSAKETVRQIMGVAPRVIPPTVIAIDDDSSDEIQLDPELQQIAQQARLHAHQPDRHNTPSLLGLGGPPEVDIIVKWVPHPNNPDGRRESWRFTMKRHDTFEEIFADVAELASVLSDHLYITHDNRRVFQSATPDSLRIWAQGELEACDKIAYEYFQANRRQRSLSVQPLDNLQGRSPTRDFSPSPSLEEAGNDSGDELADGDKFRLTLRSAKTKDIVLTVRPSATCGAIVRAFLRKAGLSDQYPAAGAPANKKTKKTAVVVPTLELDGDKLDPEMEIGDADLEDGDLVDVVGL